MREITCFTVVVGSGCAGLNAADWLAALGAEDVLLVTENMRYGTSRNTGSDKQTYYKLSLAGGESDSVEDMARTLHREDVDGDLALCEAAGSARAFCKLERDSFLLCLALCESVLRRRHSFILCLLGRELFGHHGDRSARTCLGAHTAACAFIHIDNTVLCVGRSCRTDIETETILRTETEISYRISFSHGHALLSVTRSNFQAGTLQTGHISGGASPT